MLEISTEQRRALRARAHLLKPVVAISQNGLSDSVLVEIARSLDVHELIKIRVFHDERDVRENYLASICEQLGCAPVQHIGKLLVIWRPNPDAKVPVKNTSRPRRRNEVHRPKRSFQG